MYGGEERSKQCFGGNPEGERQLGRPRRRWKYNIEMDLPEVGFAIWTGPIWLRTETGGGHL
jgi:hypothetical protein